MVECKNLSLSFNGKLILDNINFRIAQGEFLCLLGQSGCGKSTLLRILAGLQKTSSGSAFFNGREITAPNRDCSVVFQDYTLFPWMTAGENLQFALKAAYPEKSKAEIRHLAESYLDMVGLSGVFNNFPGALSGGMRQRAAIARALALPGKILLMDEPFGALDPVNRVMLQQLVRDLHRDSGSGRTIVFVTHDVEEALFLGTKIAVMGSNPGRLLALENNPAHGKDTEKMQTALLREKIMDVYRQDINEKLEQPITFRNGNGI